MAKEVCILVPVLCKCCNVQFEVPPKCPDQNFEYKAKQKVVKWKIKNFSGKTKSQLKIIMHLEDDQELQKIRKEIGPIKMKFEIENYTASGFFIKYLKPIKNCDISNPLTTWIRYKTKSNSYVIRI